VRMTVTRPPRKTRALMIISGVNIRGIIKQLIEEINSSAILV